MKVSFMYSNAYDHMLTLMSLQLYQENQSRVVKNYIRDLEVAWFREEKKIVKEIEKVSGLKFPKGVECYVVNHMAYTAISHPLTIKIDDDFDRLKLVLIHELIHVALASSPECKDVVLKLNELYPKKDLYFRSHIPVFMIQKRVFENLYGKSALKKYVDAEVTEEEMPILKEADRLSRKFSRDIVKFFR